MTDLFQEEVPTFEEFWAAWPKGHKRSPKYARKCWDKLNYYQKLLVMKDLEHRQTRDPKWSRNKGRYIPHPSTYLNQEHWLDDYEDGGGGGGESLEERRKVTW